MPGCMMDGGGGNNQVDSNASQSSPSFARVAVGGRKRRVTTGRGSMYGGKRRVTTGRGSMYGGRRTRRTKRQKKSKKAGRK